VNSLAILIISACAVLPQGDVCNSYVAPQFFTPAECERRVPVVAAEFVNGIGNGGGVVFWLDVHCEIVKGDGA